MPSTALRAKYVDALCNELKKLATTDIDTIYLGGGTPSCLPIPMLDDIITALPSPLSHVCEFTIEANPEDVSDEFIAWLHNSASKIRTPRISMGVQSLDDDVLKFIGRRHTAKQALYAILELKENGIFELSIDLIYGLPFQTLTSWQYTLDHILSLNLPHLSCYMLSYEPGTRLNAMRLVGKVEETDEETLSSMYEYLIQRASESRYEHYEISNFALPGHRSIHNSGYWKGKSYLGIGTAAHSCINGKRSYNLADVKKYIGNNGIGCCIQEEETDNEKFNDFLLTRLRTSDGIDLASSPRNGTISKIAAEHIANGNMEVIDGHLRIKEERWLIADSIISDFIAL